MTDGLIISDDIDNEQPQRALAVTHNDPIEQMLAHARVLVRSGLLPPNYTPEKTLAIMLRGKELGIGPMEALSSLNYINGKVSSGTQLMLALIYRSGLLEDIEMIRADPATCMMKRKNMTPHKVSFGSKDAQIAGLLFKDNYRKWPEVMFLWRAIAMCARVVFPDIVGAVYTPDELGVSIRSDAELVETDWTVVDAELDPDRENRERAKELQAQDTDRTLPEIAQIMTKELGITVLVPQVATWLL